MSKGSTSQLDMFGNPQARARGTDPETSHIAAASIDDLRPRQAEIFRIVAAHGPMTHDAMNKYCLLNHTDQSARTRCSELVDLGLVEWSGGYGETDNGGKARLWVRRW